MPNTKTLAALVDFILTLMAAGHCCFVHCLAGMNRSAMVAALVLRKYERLTGRQAVARVRRARHKDALFNKVFHDHVVHSL